MGPVKRKTRTFSTGRRGRRTPLRPNVRVNRRGVSGRSVERRPSLVFGAGTIKTAKSNLDVSWIDVDPFRNSE